METILTAEMARKIAHDETVLSPMLISFFTAITNAANKGHCMAVWEVEDEINIDGDDMRLITDLGYIIWWSGIWYEVMW